MLWNDQAVPTLNAIRHAATVSGTRRFAGVRWLPWICFLLVFPTWAMDDPSFEVVSVKAAGRPGPGENRNCTGGPGTPQPGTWSCPHATIAGLVFLAYDLELYDYNAQDWIAETFVSVSAKVPPDTTKEQFRKMQQRLLAERFLLKFHWQPKEASVYELVVDKNGPKLHDSAVDAQGAEVNFGVVAGFKVGQDRYPVFPDGVMGLMGVNSHIRWRSSNVTMADLVKVLRRQMSSDVVDQTGLTGKYDIDMRWQQRPFEILPSAPPFDGPDIEKAIQDRLGLKLQSKKGTISVFTIDHVEKIPIEN